MGGRRLAGKAQLYFSVTGFFLVVIWMFKFFIGITMSQINETPSVPVPAGWWQLGVLLFGIGWGWSLLTSVSLVLEAKNKTCETLPQVPPKRDDRSATLPPKLAAAPKPTPPRLGGNAPADPKIEAALATVPAWKKTGATIARTFQFQDFPAAIAFVDQVAELAEAAGHHPDIDIRWNKVTLALTTHDAGGLTEKDFSLARQCDRL